MHTFFRWVAVLVLILTIAIIGICVFGSTRSLEKNNLLRVLFANPNGAPCEKLCLFSIYPNNVKQVEDQQRLGQLPWMRDVTLSNNALSGWFDVAGTSFTFYANTTYVAVYSEVNDEFFPQPTSFSQPTLGDLITRFGSPTFTKTTNRDLTLWFEEEKLYAWTSLDDSITPRLLVDGIILFASERSIPPELQNNRWHGFTHGN